MNSVYESIWAAHRILFEANAGDAMRKGITYLSSTYGMDRVKGREVCQMVRQACFDIFSDDHSLADKTKDQRVKDALAVFVPILHMLGGVVSLDNLGPRDIATIRTFGEHFRDYVLEHGVHVAPGNSLLDNEGNQVNARAIMSQQLKSSAVPTTAVYGGKSRYTVVPITSHAEAMEYIGKIPFCLTWRTMEYWNRYTNHGQMKCYFLLRDDYETVQQPDEYNDDDDYARSAIALVVDNDGNIDSLYNRRNHVDKIYNEAQLSELLCTPFRRACPPYTEAERTHAAEVNEAETAEAEAAANNYVRPPVTRGNFVDIVVDEYRWMSDYETNPEGYESATLINTFEDIATCDGINLYMTDTNMLSLATITDSEDGNSYSAIFFFDFDDDYVGRITDWVKDYRSTNQEKETLFPCKTDNGYCAAFPIDNEYDSAAETIIIFNGTVYYFSLDSGLKKLLTLPRISKATPVITKLTTCKEGYTDYFCLALIVAGCALITEDPQNPKLIPGVHYVTSIPKPKPDGRPDKYILRLEGLKRHPEPFEVTVDVSGVWYEIRHAYEY